MKALAEGDKQNQVAERPKKDEEEEKLRKEMKMKALAEADSRKDGEERPKMDEEKEKLRKEMKMKALAAAKAKAEGHEKDGGKREQKRESLLSQSERARKAKGEDVASSEDVAKVKKARADSAEKGGV